MNIKLLKIRPFAEDNPVTKSREDDGKRAQEKRTTQFNTNMKLVTINPSDWSKRSCICQAPIRHLARKQRGLNQQLPERWGHTFGIRSEVISSRVSHGQRKYEAH